MCSRTAMSAACGSYRSFSRRRILAAAAGSAGAAALANPLTMAAERLGRRAESDGGGQPAVADSLLLVWLQGGPSQLETFDPHAGTAIGGEVRAIPTSVRGCEIADSLPRVAEKMHLATLVRSMVSKEGDHERATINLKTGWRPQPTLIHPSIGAILAHAGDSNVELPLHISINPGQWPGWGGFLGATHDAFQVRDPAEGIGNLQSPVDRSRRELRLKAQRLADQRFARGRIADLDSLRLQQKDSTDRAIALMDSRQLEAFDLDRESDTLRRSFGDTAFGRGCLAAVRLLAEGVRCVEVELAGWDSHVNNHSLQYEAARTLDDALAATLSLLEDRDMLARTVVLVAGEFGRTPTINLTDGRDHWPTGFSALLAGGPFRRGYVHGATVDRVIDSEEVSDLVTDAVNVPDLHATVLAACGIAPDEKVETPVGRPIAWSEGVIRREWFDKG